MLKIGSSDKNSIFADWTLPRENLSSTLQRQARFISFTWSMMPERENKGADQPARMRRLVCPFVVRMNHKVTWLILGIVVRRHVFRACAQSLQITPMTLIIRRFFLVTCTKISFYDTAEMV